MSFDWFTGAFEAPSVSAGALAFRLLLALAAGFVVAFIHRTGRSAASANGLAATLVLLAVLIAAVTQVIGDNVARAFSLVGALSIVRFRTVVPDTRDTAFVIAAVVAGMAVGSAHADVALGALAAVGLASALLKSAPLRGFEPAPHHELTVRLGLGAEFDPARAPGLAGCLATCAPAAASLARQGAALELAWHVTLRPGVTPEQVIRALSRTDGVQSAELRPAADS
jgi:hypothetical protein